PPRPFELGEAVEHPEVHVMGVGVGDLAGAQLVVGERRVELELLELDRWPLSAGVLEDDFLRQLSPPRLRKPAATTCPSRTGPGCGEGRVGFRRSSPAPVGRGDPPPYGGCRRGPPCGHRYRCR